MYLRGREGSSIHVSSRIERGRLSPVDDVDTDGGVDVVGERVLPDEAAPDGQNIGGVEARVHRGRLTRVNHEEDLVVAALRPHLLEGVRQLHVRDLFRILDKALQKLSVSQIKGIQ